MGAYKYGKNRNLGNFFAQIIEEHLHRFLSPPEIPQYWVPVPPRPGKIKKTGWDQVDFLCRCLKKLPSFGEGKGEEQGFSPSASVPAERGPSFRVYPCLKRLPSQSQKELNREARLRNLTGRIYPTAPVPSRALLLDDLVTTGSTLEACAAALKAAGAEEIMGLTLFYD
jgi:predicted amidophosphoribosyltransferase